MIKKTLMVLCGLFYTIADAISLRTNNNIIGKTLDKCCVTCDLPRMKYFYINDTDHTCSETCLTSKEFSLYKLEFPKLEQDDKSTLPCERYNYHIVDSTVKKGKCPICTYFDVYDQDYHIYEK